MIGRVLLIVSLLLGSDSAAQAQAGFLFGLALGSMSAGSPTASGAEPSVLYVAAEEVRKSVDIMQVRQVATEVCGVAGYSNSKPGASLAELYQDALKRTQLNGERVLLQVVRVFNPHNPACATVWFAYAEKPKSS